MKVLSKCGARVQAFSLAAFAAVLGAVVAPSSAFAQTGGVTFDPAPVIAIVDSATTFITTVGLAVLVLLMIAKGIKWARKAG